VAVFDLDGTLIRGDSFLPFVLWYAWRRRRIRPLLSLPIYLGLYACRLMPDRKAKQAVLISFLRGRSKEDVAEHAEWFSQRWVDARLKDAVMARLREHQEAGHRVVLLSASPDVYVPVIARKLGIEEVLCTPVAGDEVCWDGRLAGNNCKGEEKVQRLKEHLQQDSPPAESWAYGDSSSDLPLLRWVARGYLVRREQLLPVSRGPAEEVVSSP
jgi:phosphatidylglycerophosphatase C